MNVVPHLSPDEPLSPELVLVLPAELRSQALARLGPPIRFAPSPRLHAAPPPVAEPFARAVGTMVAARFAQLGLIFVFVTIVTLAMSLVAHAVR